MYAAFAALGVAFGPRFQTIKSVHFEGAQASAVLEAAADLAGPKSAASSPIHPTVLDGALQSCLIASAGSVGLPKERLLPVGIDRFTTFGRAPARLHAFTTVRREGDGGSLTADVELRAPDGTLVALIEGARFAPSDCALIAPARPGGRDAARDRLGAVAPNRSTGGGHRSGVDHLCGRSGERRRARDGVAGQGRALPACAPGSANWLQVGPDVWTIDPAQPAHVASILAETAWRQGASIAGLAHLWSLDIEPLASHPGSRRRRCRAG